MRLLPFAHSAPLQLPRNIKLMISPCDALRTRFFPFSGTFSGIRRLRRNKIYIICKKIKIPMEIHADLWYTVM